MNHIVSRKTWFVWKFLRAPKSTAFMLVIVLVYSFLILYVNCDSSVGNRRCIDEYVPFRPVIFVHVFKTGGSSMREIFRLLLNVKSVLNTFFVSVLAAE